MSYKANSLAIRKRWNYMNASTKHQEASCWPASLAVLHFHHEYIHIKVSRYITEKKMKVVLMPTLLSLEAPQIDIMKTYCDEKVGIMTTPGYQCTLLFFFYLYFENGMISEAQMYITLIFHFHNYQLKYGTFGFPLKLLCTKVDWE